jgi:hypothetical protein
MRKLWRILVAAVVATGLSASPAAGASPRIESRLLQEFWTYALETPVAENPFTLGTACVPLRRDVVVPFATLDGGPLTCTVTARTRVFVTVINWECSTSENPTIGGSPRELRSCARANVDAYPVHTLTLDGRSVPQTRVETHPISVHFPPDNVLGTSDRHALSVGVAWVALLPQLRPGRHTIVIHDSGPTVDPVDSVTTIVVSR